ncbi:hypothetical protein EBR78_01565 [bacterium]|nr:hypothetical protein [bacterium]NBX83435.1 hypothetical protein [bacterium]
MGNFAFFFTTFLLISGFAFANGRQPVAGQAGQQNIQNPDGTFRQATKREQLQDRIAQISKAAGGSKGGGGGGGGSGGSSSNGSSGSKKSEGPKPLDPASFQIKSDFSQGQKSLDALVKASAESKDESDKLFKELSQSPILKPVEPSPAVDQAETLAQTLLQSAMKAIQQISVTQPQSQLLANARAKKRSVVGRPMVAGFSLASGSFGYPSRGAAAEMQRLPRASDSVSRGIARDRQPKTLRSHDR